MFKYPYGDSQQLNLDWILAKLKELEDTQRQQITEDLEVISNALISATFSSSNAYNRSDIVYHYGKLYRANVNIPAPGESWNPAHWDEIMLGDTVANLVRYVSSLNNTQVFNSSTVPGTHTSDALDNLKSDIDVNADKIEAIVRTYNTDTTYYPNEYVIKAADRKLYQCIAQTSGAWDPSKWSLVSDAAVDDLYDKIRHCTDPIVEHYDPDITYYPGDLAIRNVDGQLYICVNQTTGEWTYGDWQLIPEGGLEYVNNAINSKMNNEFVSGDVININSVELGSSSATGICTVIFHTERVIPANLTISNTLTCGWIRYNGNTNSPVTVTSVSRATANTLTIILTPNTALPNAYVCACQLSGQIKFT